LYLKNSFCYGTLFRKYAAINENYKIENPPLLDTEKKRLEYVNMDNENYFGDKHLKENDDEQVDGTEFQLRIMLREESFLCIDEFMSQCLQKDETTKLNYSKMKLNDFVYKEPPIIKNEDKIIEKLINDNSSEDVFDTILF